MKVLLHCHGQAVGYVISSGKIAEPPFLRFGHASPHIFDFYCIYLLI